jgi:hypothetical protein
MPDGKVTYVKKGETYFLPYGITDLQEQTIPVKVGDQVSIYIIIILIIMIILGNI